MSNKRIDEVVELLLSIPPIMHRKMVRDVFRTALAQVEKEIAPHHLMILRVLYEFGPLHMTEVGEEISISRPQMTHSTDKLISLGMVERQHDVKDRRKINIKLTNKGEKTIKKLQQFMKSQMKEKLSSLDEEDLDRLAASLKTMADTFTKIR
ncbi:MAG: MarR family transcriptional regulator [Dehalococcoidia bacterium]